MMYCCRAASIPRSRSSGCENAIWNPDCSAGSKLLSGLLLVVRAVSHEDAPGAGAPRQALPHARRRKQVVDVDAAIAEQEVRRRRHIARAAEDASRTPARRRRGFRQPARPRPRCRAGRSPGRDCCRSRGARPRRLSAKHALERLRTSRALRFDARCASGRQCAMQPASSDVIATRRAQRCCDAGFRFDPRLLLARPPRASARRACRSTARRTA